MFINLVKWLNEERKQIVSSEDAQVFLWPFVQRLNRFTFVWSKSNLSGIVFYSRSNKFLCFDIDQICHRGVKNFGIKLANLADCQFDEFSFVLSMHPERVSCATHLGSLFWFLVATGTVEAH